MVTEISLIITLALIVLGVALMVLFGAKNLFSGKHEIQQLITAAFPFALFGITYIIMGDATAAAMATMLIMIGLMGLFVLVAGLRSSFKF